MNRAPPRSHQLLAAIRDGKILKAARRVRADRRSHEPHQPTEQAAPRV